MDVHWKWRLFSKNLGFTVCKLIKLSNNVNLLFKTFDNFLNIQYFNLRASSFQCQRIFQVSTPVNCVSLHPNQSELIVGDQSGIVHLWDLRSDHNEQLVKKKRNVFFSFIEITREIFKNKKWI